MRYEIKEEITMAQRIELDGYTLNLSDPILYIDNQSRGRSGHMTHAMVQWAPGKIIDFNANCSARIHRGHSTFGWVEYRLSEDGGETFSDFHTFPYSWQSFIDGEHTISVEKAVGCDNGRIVAFCLRNCPTTVCQPWGTPMVVCSDDGAQTWSDARELCNWAGRTYDAVYHKGVIYVLHFCNDGTGHFCGEKPEHVYRIYTSHDNAQTFQELCVVPIPSLGRGYGAMQFDDQDRLHVYAYNINDERHMDHVITEDFGRTWGDPETCYLDKAIRNPQTAWMDGLFLLHGRAENGRGFVLYASGDGSSWSEGTIIAPPKLGCYYSNNLVLPAENGRSKLLIQYSDTYNNKQVNVKHMWLRIDPAADLP